MHQTRPSYQAVIRTPFGALGLCVQETRLKSIDFLPEQEVEQAAKDAATARIVESLRAYLKDPFTPFAFEPLLEGTDFQQRVWRRLMRIPPGETVTYGRLAQELRSSPRAIGNACRANPCPIVAPLRCESIKSGGR